MGEMASNLDFELLIHITTHSKLGIKGAENLLDFIVHVGCIYDPLYAGLSSNILIYILRRFHHNIVVLKVFDSWISNDLSKKIQQDDIMAIIVFKKLKAAQLPGFDSRLQSLINNFIPPKVDVDIDTEEKSKTVEVQVQVNENEIV